MAVLPPHPDLDQLRRRAKELLAAARRGEQEAGAEVLALSPRPTLAAAQLALARRYGFAGWPALQAEVVRRQVLDARDLDRLAPLLAADPALVTRTLRGWADHPLGASPLGYVAMLRFDTARQVWRDVPGTGALAQVLLAAGAAVDGEPDDPETPLITAASYGDAEVAAVLVAAGADLERRSALTSGGVPDATALLHAAVFGMTAVVDLLAAAGAQVPDVVQAAAVGDLGPRPLDRVPPEERVLALVMAADHQRLTVIDALVAAGTPVDAEDRVWARHPLRLAAERGRPAAVRRLLQHGADPRATDARGRTPLELCRAARVTRPDSAGHRETEALLSAR